MQKIQKRRFNTTKCIKRNTIESIPESQGRKYAIFSILADQPIGFGFLDGLQFVVSLELGVHIVHVFFDGADG